MSEWTNQRHRQALRQSTENEQTRDTSIIEIIHRMDKPKTQAFLGHLVGLIENPA
jgi:hypothetical protein